jgi:hypothetical protein
MLATMPAQNAGPASSSHDSDSESELALRTESPVLRSQRPCGKVVCETSSGSVQRQKADELLRRYHNALDAAGLQMPKGRPELVSETKETEAEDEGEEEEDRDGEFVYVKKSIQQFLNVRVLSLEKDNYAIRSEIEASRESAARAALALRSQRLQHGLSVLASMVARRERALLSSAFSQLRAAAAAARADKAKSAELKELRNLVAQLQAVAAAPAQPAREPASPKARRHSAPVAALDGGAGDALEMLRAENRRLQIELEDRSRAAELLCKRLLRVDAVARSMSH